jgi:high-affinity nickel-transport protein
MAQFLSLAFLGFLLGMRHATDPDHVVAVTTIVAGQRSIRRAAYMGAAWGVGHTLTILLVGSAIIVFKWVIPPRLGLGMEMAVAMMLIILGVLNLGGTLRWIRRERHIAERPAHIHSHAHSHGHALDAHPHADDVTSLAHIDCALGMTTPYRLVRPLVVGIVHGLAGSAAVALLVLAAIQMPLWSVAYLLIFGIGTIAGMMVITAAISIPFALTGGQFGRVARSLRVASGILSLGFGLIVAYQIGVVDGLFGAQVHWTPK